MLKLPITIFYENSFCGSRVVCYKQTDIHTDMMEPTLSDAFLHFFCTNTTNDF